MLIAGTKANRTLAGAVNRRVSADAALLTAKAWLIRCLAIGAMGMMIGGGVGLAFLGYAKSKDASGAAERLAATLTQALERSKLHAELDPNATVKLDPGAQVSLDPDAKVRMADPAALPRPTRAQLNPEGAPPSRSAVKTNYTVFKTVKWGSGQVVTGYVFAPEGKVPEHQYCYFADGIDKQSFKTIHVGAEGRFLPPPGSPGFDATKAAAECIWFDGKPTLF